MVKLQDIKFLCSLIYFTMQYMKHNFMFSRRVAAMGDMHRNKFSGQKYKCSPDKNGLPHSYQNYRPQKKYKCNHKMPVVVLLNFGTLWTNNFLQKLQKEYVETVERICLNCRKNMYKLRQLAYFYPCSFTDKLTINLVAPKIHLVIFCYLKLMTIKTFRKIKSNIYVII